jgi:hypothetical protein
MLGIALGLLSRRPELRLGRSRCRFRCGRQVEVVQPLRVLGVPHDPEPLALAVDDDALAKYRDEREHAAGPLVRTFQHPVAAHNRHANLVRLHIAGAADHLRVNGSGLQIHRLTVHQQREALDDGLAIPVFANPDAILAGFPLVVVVELVRFPLDDGNVAVLGVERLFPHLRRQQPIGRIAAHVVLRGGVHVQAERVGDALDADVLLPGRIVRVLGIDAPRAEPTRDLILGCAVYSRIALAHFPDIAGETLDYVGGVLVAILDRPHAPRRAIGTDVVDDALAGNPQRVELVARARIAASFLDPLVPLRTRLVDEPQVLQC